MKKNVYITISIFAVLISLICGFVLGYYYCNSNKNDSIGDNDAFEDEVLSLTADELNQKIKALNEPLDYYDCVLLYQNFAANAFDNDGKIKLDVNLFSDVETKIKISVLLDGLKYEANGNEAMIDYDILKKSYEKNWGQSLDLVADSDNKVKAFDIPYGAMPSSINIKAKGIISSGEKDIYVLKTYVGVAVDLKDGTISYNYDNDYEGQLIFSKSNGEYKINSFVIVEK